MPKAGIRYFGGAPAALAIALLLVAGCSNDDPANSEVGRSAGGGQREQVISSELFVSEVIEEEDLYGVSITGYLLEVDGDVLLCDQPISAAGPSCEGSELLVLNGDVIDPIVFVGEDGARYSDTEVVLTGDVVDGELTIR